MPLPQLASVGVTVECEVVAWLLRRASGRPAAADCRASAKRVAVASPTSPSVSAASPTPSAPARSRDRPRLPTPSTMAPLPLLLSSPYLNLPHALIDSLLAPRRSLPPAALDDAAVAPTLLSSAPSASGFYNAGGVKGLIPQVYSALEAQLLRAAAERQAPLRLLHYLRDGWTYHAKGLWLWPPRTPTDACGAVGDGEKLGGPHTPSRLLPPPRATHPVLTLIGSTNLSERSSQRDIELSACLVTTDAAVRAQLHEEQARLTAHAVEVQTQTLPAGSPPADAPPSAAHAAARVSLLARGLAVLLRSFF